MLASKPVRSPSPDSLGGALISTPHAGGPITRTHHVTTLLDNNNKPVDHQYRPAPSRFRREVVPCPAGSASRPTIGSVRSTDNSFRRESPDTR